MFSSMVLFLGLFRFATYCNWEGVTVRGHHKTVRMEGRYMFIRRVLWSVGGTMNRNSGGLCSSIWE